MDFKKINNAKNAGDVFNSLTTCCGLSDIGTSDIVNFFGYIGVDEPEDMGDFSPFKKAIINYLDNTIQKSRVAGLIITDKMLKSPSSNLHKVLDEICGKHLVIGTNPKTRNKIIIWIYGKDYIKKSTAKKTVSKKSTAKKAN